MVIDSSATSRRILVEQLHHWGVRAHACTSGGDALRQLRQAQDGGDPYRIAILSNHLQGMDAIGVGDLVKSDPELRSTDLVLLTPLGEQGDARRLGQIGFSGYLVKPIQEEALRETLAVVWGARRDGEDPGLVTRHRLEDSGVLETPSALPQAE
jgi:CheY-like chemotaxis protein